MRHYHVPKICIQKWMGNPILTSSSKDSDSSELITINVKDYGMNLEQDEVIIAAHGNCKIMKNGGREVGTFMGKTYFSAQADSLQRIICCITNKRVILIPQDDKEKSKQIFSLAGSITGIDWVGKRIAMSMFFKNWLDFSVQLRRDEIVSAKVTEESILDIVEIALNQRRGTIYLGTEELGHALDIVITIRQPELFLT